MQWERNKRYLSATTSILSMMQNDIVVYLRKTIANNYKCLNNHVAVQISTLQYPTKYLDARNRPRNANSTKEFGTG